MNDPLEIIARTFQRGEALDEDWFAGRAAAAIANLNAQRWRIVRNDMNSPTPHISLAVNQEARPEGVTRARQDQRPSKGPRPR